MLFRPQCKGKEAKETDKISTLLETILVRGKGKPINSVISDMRSAPSKYNRTQDDMVGSGRVGRQHAQKLTEIGFSGTGKPP